MPVKNILFRADGSPDIGLGHVYRCLAIAERLQGKVRCFFAIENPSESLEKTISQFGEMIRIEEGKGLDPDYLIKKFISPLSIDVSVLDGYLFDTTFQSGLIYHTKVVSIDDHQPFHYVSHAVINHAPNISPDLIFAEPYTRKYIGIRYAMLRKPFIEANKKQRLVSRIKNAFICFGGGDQKEIIRKVLKYSLECKVFERIDLVTSDSSFFIDSVKEYRNVRVNSNLSAEEMLNLMQASDLAIVPSSTTAMECLAAGMLLVTGMTADNQEFINSGLEMYPNVTRFDSFNSFSPDLIESIIRSLKSKLPIASPSNLFDENAFQKIFLS